MHSESPPQQPPTVEQSPLRPWWVKLGLWGLRSRASALACLWLSVLLAGASLAFARVDPRAAIGVVLLFAALWYGLSIRWVDRHTGW